MDVGTVLISLLSRASTLSSDRAAISSGTWGLGISDVEKDEHSG